MDAQRHALWGPNCSMRMQPRTPRRKRLRLRDFDYSAGGVFFVTICTVERAPILGWLAGGRVMLTPTGRIVEQAWCELPRRFPGLTLGAHVVMPEHFHGILVPPDGVSLSKVIQAFKSISTVRAASARERASRSW